MERNARRAEPGVRLRVLVPLTSRDEEDRYWCDQGWRGALDPGATEGLFGFDSLESDEDWAVGAAWVCLDRRPGH
jgi:hypothetical protein